MEKTIRLEQRPVVMAGKRVELLLMSALAQVENRQISVEATLKDALTAIEEFPLSTDDFALASNRLRNTINYVNINIWGAALFELNLLRRWFIQQQVRNS